MNIKDLFTPGMEFDNNENDFEVGEKINIKEILLANQITPKKRNTFDQLSRQCGPTAMFLSVCDLFNYSPTEKDFVDLREMSKSYGWADKKGMLYSESARLVKNFWNAKFPNKKIWYVKINVGSEEFKTALECGYRVPLGYKISQKHLDDSQAEGILNGNVFPKGSGHLVSMFGENIEVDNYPSKLKFNNYTNKNLEELVKNGVYSNNTYLFLKGEYSKMGVYEKLFYFGSSKGQSNRFSDAEGYVKTYSSQFDEDKQKNARETAFANLIAFNTKPKIYFR